MKIRLTLAMGLAISLHACGGDNPPPISGTPTPPPTATPTPTPTPTPSYATFNALAGDRSFATSCATVDLRTSPTTFVVPSVFGSGLDVSYAASTSSYRIRGFGIDLTFGPSDLRGTPANVVQYGRSRSDFSAESIRFFSADFNGTLAEYVRQFSLFYSPVTIDPVYSYCILGVPTQSNDTFPAAFDYSDLSFEGTVFIDSGAEAGSYDLSQSTGQLRFDAATNRVSFVLEFAGESRQTTTGVPPENFKSGVFGGTATIDVSAQSFIGTVSSGSLADASGTVAGWVFGPQAIEGGMAFSVQGMRTDGSILRASGTVAGRRQ